MSKSTDLMTLQEVAEFYGLSVQSIRRRLKEAKSGKSTVPTPDIRPWTQGVVPPSGYRKFYRNSRAGRGRSGRV